MLTLESLVSQHQPHKYYNFPSKNKKRERELKPSEESKICASPIPKVNDASKVDETTQGRIWIPHSVVPELDSTSLTSKNDQIVYKIETFRLKVNKERDYENFIQQINERQRKRKADKKAKNRKEVSMKEYIDDYFMRQLGYSVLRMETPAKTSRR